MLTNVLHVWSQHVQVHMCEYGNIENDNCKVYLTTMHCPSFKNNKQIVNSVNFVNLDLNWPLV